MIMCPALTWCTPYLLIKLFYARISQVGISRLGSFLLKLALTNKENVYLEKGTLHMV